ncbi:MAG TPA: Rap1a/Tai family immunity protein [Alphaproteobacteria bacterium]|nr:Rap1a/Tai family immunity protein [Alphaproteobacteria bacterium]
MTHARWRLQGAAAAAAIAVVALMAGAGSPARAQQAMPGEDKSSAGFLYRLCQDNTQDSPRYYACHAYLYGMIQTLRDVKDPSPLLRYCLPDSANTEEVRLTFNRWSQQHPKAMSLPAPYAVSRALSENYGCK